MWRGVLGLFLLFAACGRPGDPLPPFIRIPETINDLAVAQRGYDLILTWTSPARNIDGSAAMDLEVIRIFADGVPLAMVDARMGERQSFVLPARPLTNAERTFAVQAETSAEKVSGISNSVSITAVDVPGRVSALRHLVDQNRITLEWDPPAENPELANVYLISETSESGPGESAIVESGRTFEDSTYDLGTTRTYSVTPMRRSGGELVAGITSEAIEVAAIDRTAPAPPSGLEILVDEGVFLIWNANTESDLAGYRVFRSDRSDGDFAPLAPGLRSNTGIFDAGYRPGLYYAVSAVDESGNESQRSAPLRVP